MKSKLEERLCEFAYGSIAQEQFRAGALWLLEQANQICMDQGEIWATDLTNQLQELCHGEKEHKSNE